MRIIDLKNLKIDFVSFLTFPREELKEFLRNNNWD